MLGAAPRVRPGTVPYPGGTQGNSRGRESPEESDFPRIKIPERRKLTRATCRTFGSWVPMSNRF